jgi:hypothetical protein
VSVGCLTLWAAIYYSDNKDDITVNFRGFAISHEKQAVCDLLQNAKEVTCEAKMKLGEGAMGEC